MNEKTLKETVARHEAYMDKCSSRMNEDLRAINWEVIEDRFTGEVFIYRVKTIVILDATRSLEAAIRKYPDAIVILPEEKE